MADNPTARRLRRIRQQLLEGAWLVRCDGSRRDVANYRLGRDDPGWGVVGDFRPGDVLLDTTGSGRSRQIVAVTPVAEVTAGAAVWVEGTDIPLWPAIPWDAVADEPHPSAPWPGLRGDRAIAFIDGLISAHGKRPRISEAEGRRRTGVCRSHSESLRAAALDLHLGRCQACGLQPRAIFGPDGDRAIDVHHHTPLSVSGETTTTFEDVSVVCASCHRLLHLENPPLTVDAIRDIVVRTHSWKGGS